MTRGGGRWFGNPKENPTALRCGLCPHGCLLEEGETGRCGVRRNRDGTLALPYYGRLSALAVDPIEKKPLHHFLPGSSVLSAGLVGCNLNCPFCQNWRISQSLDEAGPFVEPEALVDRAVQGGWPSIALTYSEPAVHAEYALDLFAAARERGLCTVLVTNGCVNRGPGRELLALTDAVNVDLKAWKRETYADILGGDRDAVLAFIEDAVALGVETEATTLVVTDLNDSAEELGACAAFLAGLSADLPYHLSAYRPEWRWSAPATAPVLLAERAAAAKERLNYVYVGNLPGAGSDTVCPSCGATAIRRSGYRTEATGLAAGDDGSARCAVCGAPIPVVLDPAKRRGLRT